MGDVEGGVEVCSTKKQRLEIDFDRLFEDSNDDPPPEIVISKAAGDPPRQRERWQSAETTDGEIERLSDKDLEEKIRRMTSQVARLSAKLPDKGAKLISHLRALEEERERRIQGIGPKAAAECKVTDHTESLRPSGSSPEVRVGDRSGSRFANLFAQKLETIKESHTRIYDAFDDEPRTFGHIDRRKRKQKAQPFDKGRENFSLASNKRIFLNQNDHAEDYERHKLKTAFQGPHSDKSVIDKTVVLLDEEEPKLEERMSDGVEVAIRDMTIYYPSRDDLECVEVRYKDLKCLCPKEYLTSTIMNFYIRFLQGTSSIAAADAPRDYHFFNTYFYKKLQEAVSLKVIWNSNGMQVGISYDVCLHLFDTICNYLVDLRLKV